MHPDISLKENVSHGTGQRPVVGIHFETGPGTLFPEPFFIRKHWHHTVEILYISKGTYLMEINLEQYRLQQGDICFLNAEDLHQIAACGSGTCHEAVLFDPRILDFSYPDEWEEQFISPFITRQRTLSHFLHPTDQSYSVLQPIILKLIEISQKKADGWYSACKLLLLQLLNQMDSCHLILTAEDTLSSEDRLKIERYKTLVSYMEQNLSQTVTLEDLAGELSCSVQYMCRLFKEIAGTSPMQYLISRRIEHACILLSCTSDPILEISMDCGFPNVSYFIRKFRQLRGCTPNEYRRSLR